jgi:hypothetical protein
MLQVKRWKRSRAVQRDSDVTRVSVISARHPRCTARCQFVVVALVVAVAVVAVSALNERIVMKKGTSRSQNKLLLFVPMKTLLLLLSHCVWLEL